MKENIFVFFSFCGFESIYQKEQKIAVLDAKKFDDTAKNGPF